MIRLWIHCSSILIFIFLNLLHFNIFTSWDIRSNKLMKNSREISDNEILRRDVYKSIKIATVFSSLFYNSKSAMATRGAFEMDAQYYLNNMIRKNDIIQQKSQIFYKSPRVLEFETSKKTYDIVISALEINTNIQSSDIKIMTSQYLEQNLHKYISFLPIKYFNIRDQYYFDITLLSLYIFAAKNIQDSPGRINLRNFIGKALIETFFPHLMKNFIKTNDMKSIFLSIIEILDFYKVEQFISSYSIDSEAFPDEDDIIKSNELVSFMSCYS